MIKKDKWDIETIAFFVLFNAAALADFHIYFSK